MSESLKGPVLVSQPSFVALNRARAREGLRDVDCGSLYGDVFGIQMGSSPLVPNLIEITNKALMEEAFKYTDYHPCSLFSLEKRDFSSSSTSSRRDGAIVFIDGGFEQGCVSEEVGVVGLGPLRVILANGRETEVSGYSGKVIGVVDKVREDVSERAIQEVVEEMVKAGEPCWYSSCLAKFSRCLGMLTKGFEWDILILLKMMKEMKHQKRKLDGRKKKKLESS